MLVSFGCDGDAVSFCCCGPDFGGFASAGGFGRAAGEAHHVWVVGVDGHDGAVVVACLCPGGGAGYAWGGEVGDGGGCDCGVRVPVFVAVEVAVVGAGSFGELAGWG